MNPSSTLRMTLLGLLAVLGMMYGRKFHTHVYSPTTLVLLYITVWSTVHGHWSNFRHRYCFCTITTESHIFLK